MLKLILNFYPFNQWMAKFKYDLSALKPFIVIIFIIKFSQMYNEV